jgi:hypothetical protein
MSTKRGASFGPSTVPVKFEGGPLLLHIQSSMQALVDRTK